MCSCNLCQTHTVPESGEVTIKFSPDDWARLTELRDRSGEQDSMTGFVKGCVLDLLNLANAE